jgi:inositol-phosphate phosphatase/L-galactose 1-phosphate phosphatase/histidinol-phosphatase
MIPSRQHVDLANALADASGAILRRHFRTALEVDDKADASPVTTADREVEAELRRMIEARAPGHGIIGEEFGSDRAGAELVWVIDPIDGTKAFITGRPTFGTLLALLHEGLPVLGVIDQPIVGDRWLGAAGQPTLHNGRPARVRTCPRLEGARLSTTGSQYFTEDELRRFERVVKRVKFTTYGGDCYQYGLVAIGGIDVVIESGLKIHDHAALAPVVIGAGGVMTDWQGRALDVSSAGDAVASGDARVHEEVLAILAQEPQV